MCWVGKFPEVLFRFQINLECLSDDFTVLINGVGLNRFIMPESSKKRQGVILCAFLYSFCIENILLPKILNN